MPFVVACDPPQGQNTPSNGKGKAKVPLRPALANITPTPSPSATIKRTPLGVRSIASAATKDQPSETRTEEIIARFPSATINVDRFGATMAARLVACLLGHVLFLKGQIPFTVVQLKRMALQARAGEHPNKKSEALLSSFDVLSAQLVPSFTALALAQSSASHPRTNVTSCKSRSAKTHVVIILGPSATSMIAARARVVLEIDGLRVPHPKIVASTLSTCAGPGPNEGLKENALPYASWSDKKTRSSPVSLAERQGLHDVSRLSPSFNVSSHAGDDESDSRELPFDTDTEYDRDSSDGDLDKEVDSPDDVPSTPLGTETDITAAERTLSRALAIANADPELGMTSDTRPTQIHVLIRAPRRFSHPAWIPRQTLNRDLDPILDEFKGPSPSGRGKNALRKQGSIKTDYVRIRSRGAVSAADVVRDDGTSKGCPIVASEGDEENEESTDVVDDKGEEMIWWSWDGRLEGFTEM